MNSSVDNIVVIFCNECEYEEELHYNQFIRNPTLYCPQCGSSLESTNSVTTISYDRVPSFEQLDFNGLQATTLA